MKITKILLGTVLAATIVSCGNAELESRITKLEGRVAALEGKGGVASTPSMAQPVATSSSSTSPQLTAAAETATEKPEGPDWKSVV